MKGAWCECRQNYYSLGQISFKALNLGEEIVSLALSYSSLFFKVNFSFCCYFLLFYGNEMCASHIIKTANSN